MVFEDTGLNDRIHIKPALGIWRSLLSREGSRVSSNFLARRSLAGYTFAIIFAFSIQLGVQGANIFVLAPILIKVEEIPLKKMIDEFLHHAAMRLHPGTVRYKSYALKQFLAFLEKQGIDHWQDCDSKLIRQYIIDRSKNTPNNARKPLSASSMRIQFNSLSVFFDYLVAEEHIDHNPFKLVQPPKAINKLPKIASIELLHGILNIAPKNILEIRDLAICELFYSSGLRLNEMATLNLNYIDLSGNEVRIINGKGGKDRVVPIGSKAKQALLLWKEKRKKIKYADKKALFINMKGERISARQISNRIKKIGKKLSLDINLHPHLLRHSMATHMLESSKDIRAVQEILGHADISTTQAYTHLDFDHLMKVYENAHPRAKKKPR